MASMAVHQQDSDMYGSFKMELNGGGSTSSLGSAEEDSMSGSDTTSHNSLLDYQPGSHPLSGAIILGEYNPQTGSFVDAPGKSASFRRMNEKLPRLDMIRSGYPGSGQHGNNNNNNVIYENLNSFATFTSDAFLDGNPQLLIRALNSVNQHTSHSGSGSSSRRARSEKKPIPAEKKDNKYFERRKRNNYAAKKSRDYRKQREDEIAMRANQLEKDNANLKAQLAMLREEAASLQGMLMQKQMARQQSAHDQLSTRFSSFVTHGGHISV